MPYFTNDANKVIFMSNVGDQSSINLINTNGSSNIVLVNAPSVQEMYPIIRNNTTYLYTRWLSSVDHHDKIYLGYLDGSTSSSLPFNLSTANDSDPFPIGTDYVLFSSDRIGTLGGWDLVLGN